MLRDDPVVQKYPQFLPTDEEVHMAEALLRSPENRETWEAFCSTVQVGGCPTASLRRFCWQARQEKKFADECAARTAEWVRRCVGIRQRLGMDTVLSSSPFSAKFRELYIKTVPYSFHGTDREGHPVYIVRYGLVGVEAYRQLWAAGAAIQESAGMPLNGAVLFHLRNMEYLTKTTMAEETRKQGRVVDRMLTIMDVGGFGMQHYDATVRSFLEALAKESVPLFPEIMHATVVVNAPWMVAKAMWPLVRTCLNPVTQSKVVILASAKDVTATLSELLGASHVPAYFGGGCKCAECSTGVLSGGSMRAWEERRGLLAPHRELDMDALDTFDI